MTIEFFSAEDLISDIFSPKWPSCLSGMFGGLHRECGVLHSPCLESPSVFSP